MFWKVAREALPEEHHLSSDVREAKKLAEQNQGKTVPRRCMSPAMGRSLTGGEGRRKTVRWGLVKPAESAEEGGGRGCRQALARLCKAMEANVSQSHFLLKAMGILGQ